MSASNLDSCPFNSSSDQPPISTLSTFKLPNTDEIVCIIQKSKSANCQLDPIRTYLVTACLHSLSSLITDIIHYSLVSGTVSSSLKAAVIIQVTDHFHPILNLLFLSKIQERIVAAQVQDHLSDNSLHEQFHSGFHS